MRLGVVAILFTLGAAACSAGGETPAQAAGARGGGARRRSGRHRESRTEIDAAGPHRDRHGGGVIERRGPRADHRLADVGQFQGRRRRRRRARSCSRWTGGRSRGRCSRRRPRSRATWRRPPRRNRPRRGYQDLQSRGIATKEQADQSRTTAAALDATLESDRAAVENAKVQLQYATITAPLSGRTGALIVHEGNLVRANDATPLVVINQVAPIYVSFGIPEGRLPELKRYLAQGTVRVEAAAPGETTSSSGRITFIDNAVDSTTGQIRIKASFPNGDHRLWPGQFANVVGHVEHRAQRDRRPDGRRPERPAGELRLRREAGYDRRSADRRRSSDRWPKRRSSQSGLKPDEIVVTDGQLRLVPGAKVSIKSGPTADELKGGTMNLSALFIKRPVTTTLIMLGILVFGVMAYRLLPVSDLPVIDFPTIQVQAGLPGASPETMASAVALPLEKQFSTIAGLTSINSTSSQGQTQHHAAVRFEPQHRRGRAGCPGDDRAGPAARFRRTCRRRRRCRRTTRPISP